MAKKLLVIGHVWPEPKTTAAGCRMLQLLETFISFGYEITFASTAAKTEFSLNLNDLGITEAAIVLNHSSFDDFLVNLRPDTVIFDRFMVEEQFATNFAAGIGEIPIFKHIRHMMGKRPKLKPPTLSRLKI